MSGPLLMVKAVEVAKLLSHEEFASSGGWIDSLSSVTTLPVGSKQGL
jgi:hypothetical protein